MTARPLAGADRALRRRIGQLIRLLSSDQPGEAAAAAQALNRALTSAGLDIHELAELAESGLPDEPVKRPPRPVPSADARRPDGRPLKMGAPLVCDQPSGVFRACRCGWTALTVAPGVGPHVAQLACDACGAGGRWLSRKHFEESAP